MLCLPSIYAKRYLHSSVVLFEVLAQMKQSRRFLHLHSSVVLFEDKKNYNFGFQISNLHSSVVLFEDTAADYRPITFTEFTF